MFSLQVLALLLAGTEGAQSPSSGSWQDVTEKDARRRLTAMRMSGQVGKTFDTRILSTDRSYNYKLRATWITADVAVAAARLLVVTKGASAETAEGLVREFTSPTWQYVLVEIDPREGSGVIPGDWTARFGPADVEGRDIVGEIVPDQAPWRTYVGAFPRNYDYDIFLVRFLTHKTDGTPVLESTDRNAQLTVRIHDKIGRVRWPIPVGVTR